MVLHKLILVHHVHKLDVLNALIIIYVHHVHILQQINFIYNKVIVNVIHGHINQEAHA